jgi:hypothetical protein
MIALAIDENFNGDVVRGLLRRAPSLNLKRVQDAGLSSANDEVVLEWAARENRVLITQDVSTITKHAYDRIKAGRPMPGVFEVGRDVPIAQAIEDILLIAECSHPDEWEGQVRYLPLRSTRVRP